MRRIKRSFCILHNHKITDCYIDAYCDIDCDGIAFTVNHHAEYMISTTDSYINSWRYVIYK